MRKNEAPKLKANPKLFDKSIVGGATYKGFTHKDGRPYDDVDYFELLGRRCQEIDKHNNSKYLPSNYGDYNLQVVEVAKRVCKALDEGVPRSEVAEYLKLCIKTN